MLERTDALDAWLLNVKERQNDLGPVHTQSQVNYNELQLEFKSITSNFIGSICVQAHFHLA